MYQKSAAYYDAIYRAMGKDYAAEAGRVHDLIQGGKLSTGDRLLDVACGTGCWRYDFSTIVRQRSEMTFGRVTIATGVQRAPPYDGQG